MGGAVGDARERTCYVGYSVPSRLMVWLMQTSRHREAQIASTEEIEMRHAATVAAIAQATTVVGIVLLAGIAVVWGTSAARMPQAQASAAVLSPVGIAQMMANAKDLPEQAFDAI